MTESLDYLFRAPQLNADIAESVVSTVQKHGVQAFYADAKQLFISQHLSLRFYMLTLSMTKPGEILEYNRNARRNEVFQYGAAVASYAYQQSGFGGSISGEAFLLGRCSVEQGGPREIGMDSFKADPQLSPIVSALSNDRDIRFRAEDDVRDDILSYGAGLARYFLKFSLLESLSEYGPDLPTLRA